MADLTVTANQVKPVLIHNAEIQDFYSSNTLSIGDSVYLTSAGILAQSNAAVAGTAVFLGVVVANIGNIYSVLIKGVVDGYDVSGMNAGDSIFLSNTAGALADAAGTVSVVAGTVVPLADNDLTLVAYLRSTQV